MNEREVKEATDYYVIVYFLVLFLLLGKGGSDTAGNAVNVALALLGDAAAALGVLLDDADGLELLHDVADDGARGLHVVALEHASARVGATVDVAVVANANTTAEVNLAGQGG